MDTVIKTMLASNAATSLPYKTLYSLDISFIAAQIANIVALINAWLVLCKCKRMTAFHLIINNIPNTNIVCIIFWLMQF